MSHPTGVAQALSTYRRAYTASARCGILIPQPWFLMREMPSPHTDRPPWGCYEYFRTTQSIHTGPGVAKVNFLAK
jgi:hypothetical protein